MEDALNKILSDLKIVKESVNALTSTALSNAELIKRNRELLDRNFKKPAQNERLIRENREIIKGNKRQIEQNGRLLKQLLARVQQIEAKLGKGSSKKPKK